VAFNPSQVSSYYLQDVVLIPCAISVYAFEIVEWVPFADLPMEDNSSWCYGFIKVNSGNYTSYLESSTGIVVKSGEAMEETFRENAGPSSQVEYYEEPFHVGKYRI